MKSAPRAIFLVTVVAVAGLGAALKWAQREETLLLRAQLEAARLEAAEQKRLAAENERLRAQQPPAGELERLRADHAAIVRLRAELDALRKK